MNEIISLIPIIGFFAYATIMFLLSKFNFNLHVSILTVLTIFIFWISLKLDGELIILIAQTVLALITFVFMVFILSKKASGETMVAFTGLILLSPFSINFGFGLTGMILTFSLFLIYAGIFYKKEFAQASAKMTSMIDSSDPDVAESTKVTDVSMDTSDAIEEDALENDSGDDLKDSSPEILEGPRTLKGDLILGVLSTYDGQIKLPNYDYLPDTKDTKDSKRISFSIFVLIAYTLLGAGNLAYMILFLES